MTLHGIFVLLVAYQFKHFICDYPLQTEYMLGKFQKVGWARPLAAHALVHAIGTLVIVLTIAHARSDLAYFLAAFDFAAHFLMDRFKAAPRWLGRFKAATGETYAYAKIDMRDIERVYPEGYRNSPAWLVGRAILRSNTFFWWSLGFDQMVHHLTHYVIIAILVLR